jgi:hypothetical protein
VKLVIAAAALALSTAIALAGCTSSTPPAEQAAGATSHGASPSPSPTPQQLTATNGTGKGWTPSAATCRSVATVSAVSGFSGLTLTSVAPGLPGGSVCEYINGATLGQSVVAEFWPGEKPETFDYYGAYTSSGGIQVILAPALGAGASVLTEPADCIVYVPASNAAGIAGTFSVSLLQTVGTTSANFCGPLFPVLALFAVQGK